MPSLTNPRPMRTFDPRKPALLHEQLNDRIDTWKPVTLGDWVLRADWHDRAETVINCDGLLYDGWEPA